MPGEYNDPTARGDGAEVDGWRLHLIKTQNLELGGDEDLIAGDEGPRGVPGAASVLPAPQPLGFQGPYDVQEEDGGLWTTIRGTALCLQENIAAAFLPWFRNLGLVFKLGSGLLSFTQFCLSQERAGKQNNLRKIKTCSFRK